VIRNSFLIKELEKKTLAKRQLSFQEALKIYESMYDEAVKFGALPLKDPMEGIEVDIKIASILNSCLKKSSPK
jgi:hypothetical protein